MKIQVNTDNNIEGSEKLSAEVGAALSAALIHFSTHITRLLVHLSDENGDKSGHNDKRCVLEARIEGRQPTAVTCDAESMTQAVAGAADKLTSVLQSTLGRLHEHR